MAATTILINVTMSGVLPGATTDVREKLQTDTADATTGFAANHCLSSRGTIANAVTKDLFPNELVGIASQPVEFMIRFTYDTDVALSAREVSVNPDGIAAAIKARKFFAGKASDTLTVLNSTGQDVEYELFTFVQSS